MKRFQKVSDEVLQAAISQNKNKNTKKSHELWGGDVFGVFERS